MTKMSNVCHANSTSNSFIEHDLLPSIEKANQENQQLIRLDNQFDQPNTFSIQNS